MKKIYLDEAATSKVKEEVFNAMLPYFQEKFHNPSAFYDEAKEVKNEIEKAREIIADYINASPNEIYFTSGGSEANTWAIKGFREHYIKTDLSPFIITTLLEHKSLFLAIEGSRLFVRVDKEGFISPNMPRAWLKNEIEYNGKRVLCLFQLASNEIGTIQNLKNITKSLKERGVFFHTDATQYFGKYPIDVQELGVDMMTVSGHKIGTPKGIGFLYIREGTPIVPLISGTQENGMRGGTENVPYIIGLGKAVELLAKETEEERLSIIERIEKLRDKILIRLRDKYKVKLLGSQQKSTRLYNHLSVLFPQNISSENLIHILSVSGISVGMGSACNSNTKTQSNTLKAIGLSEEESSRVLRITLPDDIEEDDIDTFLIELDRAMKILLSESDKKMTDKK